MKEEKPAPPIAPRRPRWVSSIILAGLCAAALSCIQRDNPWDPANGCPLERKQAIRVQVAPVIDSAMTRAGRVQMLVSASVRAIDSILTVNRLIEESNGRTLSGNDSVAGENERIHEANLLRDSCQRLEAKHLLTPVAPYVGYDEIDTFRVWASAVSVESLKVESAILTADQQCSPHGVYTAEFRDSLQRLLTAASDSVAAAEGRAIAVNDSVRQLVSDHIKIENARIEEYNLAVRRYGDSLSFIARSCRSRIIRDPDTLEKAAPLAVAGDTLVLDSGIFHVSIRFLNSGEETRPIVVEGSPFTETVLESTDVFLSGNRHIHFNNIVFRKSLSSGVNLEGFSQGIVFDNCTFTRNRNHGLNAAESDVELRDCILQHNGQSGIRFSSSRDAANVLTLSNVLIAHNRLFGIEAVTPILRMSRTTVSDNGLDGIRLKVAQGSVDVSSSILSFNGGYGVYREEFSPDAASLLTIESSDFFGNTGGEIFADTSMFRFTLITHDPMFVDRTADDYALDSQSRLFRLEQEGVVIGYRPMF